MKCNEICQVINCAVWYLCLVLFKHYIFGRYKIHLSIIIILFQVTIFSSFLNQQFQRLVASQTVPQTLWRKLPVIVRWMKVHSWRILNLWSVPEFVCSVLYDCILVCTVYMYVCVLYCLTQEGMNCMFRSQFKSLVFGNAHLFEVHVITYHYTLISLMNHACICEQTSGCKM